MKTLKNALFILFVSAISLNAETSPFHNDPVLPDVNAQQNTAYAKQKAGEFMNNTTTGFEENKGQFVDEKGNPVPFVLYKTSAKGLDLYITEKGITYVFLKSSHKHQQPSVAEEHAPQEPGYKEFSRVDVDLLGGNIKRENIVEEFSLETNFNYYLNHCKDGVSAKKYQKITFKEVYPGIDWIWKITDGKKVKYDFDVHPNANPADIKLLYKWADISTDGSELNIHTPIGDLVEGKAISFCGDNEIKTQYKIDNNVVSFDLGAYNTSETLTIDPPLNLVWGTYMGGIDWEKNTDVSNAIDASGNIFVVSNTLSTSGFPLVNPGGGTYFQGTYGGAVNWMPEGKGGDIVIFKFSNIGVMLWATYYGGTKDDNGNGVAVDALGNVFVTGASLSSNFPLQNWAGAYNQSTWAGGWGDSTSFIYDGGDAVVLKFNNAGIRQWATFYGGAANESGQSIICDATGNIFVTGRTNSANFPLKNPGGGTFYQGANGGGYDAFFVEFNSSGVQQWSTYYGGGGDDRGFYITTDASNKIFATGQTASGNFPTFNPGSGTYFQGSVSGGSDAFIVRLSNTGIVQWSTYYGGSGIDIGRGITCSSSGKVYVTGQTNSTNFPTLNPGSGAYFQAACAGLYDIFFLEFQNSGVPVWATYLGGAKDDDGCAVVTDNCGNVYATGNTYSNNMPVANPGGGAFFVGTKQFSDDVYFLQFSATRALNWLTYNGTAGFDEKGTSLKVDNNGNLFIVGYWCFYSNSNALMNPGGGAYYKGIPDDDDLFIAKITLANCVSTCSFVANAVYSCPSGGSNNSFSLSVNSIGGYTSTPSFTWTGPGAYSSTQQNPVFPNGLYGTYTVTGSNGGCSFTATVSLSNTVITPTVTPTASITCVTNGSAVVTPTIPAGYSYSWFGSGIMGGSNGQIVSVNSAGFYTVTITNNSTGCAASAIVNIPEDKSVVTASVFPPTGNISCGGAPTTFTGMPAPQSNYSYMWYSPCGSPFAGYICSPGCAGIYTFEVTNNLNGCKSTKTATVTAIGNIPSLTIAATPNNYYVTCVTCVTMQIQASISGGGGIGVNWQNGAGTATVTTSNTFTTCTPGNYLAYAYNLASPSCSVAQLVTVMSNTTPPTVGFQTGPWGAQSPTLNCFYPCVVITGTSTAQSYSVAWNTGGTIPDNTITVCTTTNTSQTIISTPSVVVTDLINGCVRKLPVPVYQDIKPVGLIAKATPSLLTCNVVQSQLQYTPNPIGANHTFTWTTPPPSIQIPQLNPISTFNPGTYTISATNETNGCVSSTTVVVGLNNLPPAIDPIPDGTIACGSNTAQISSGVVSTVGCTYYWDGPAGSSISPITGATPKVDKTGFYRVIINNTITGCYNENFAYVVAGTLTADFTPDVENGYAPLAVNFTNLTNPSGGSSTWGYGNGYTDKSPVTINGATTYNSPGTYTVILISQKGICIDSAQKIIVVDIPSKLEVPNVFTPNGDGANDNFILHTANLSDITATIYDRWGLKMYEVTTDKGNISWDGKNLANNEVPAGTYFYVIKAKGNDGQDYNEKGTVTIYR